MDGFWSLAFVNVRPQLGALLGPWWGFTESYGQFMPIFDEKGPPMPLSHGRRTGSWSFGSRVRRRRSLWLSSLMWS